MLQLPPEPLKRLAPGFGIASAKQLSCLCDLQSILGAIALVRLASTDSCVLNSFVEIRLRSILSRRFDHPFRNCPYWNSI